MYRRGDPIPPCPLVPLGDRIIIIPDDEEGFTDFGLILPEGAREVPQEGLCVGVGPGTYAENTGRFIPMGNVNVGDKIVFSKYGGTLITLERQDYLIVAYRDVLAVCDRDLVEVGA